MKHRHLLLLALLFYSVQSQAQSQSTQTDTLTPWYVGVTGGTTFGISNFTSFGADKTRIGYNLGLLTGYRYNPILSAELSATLGNIPLATSNYSANLWLGADGVEQLSSDLAQKGYYNNEIYSSVALQQYGLHLNIHILPLINRNTKSPFNITLSPAIYATATEATIKTLADDKQFIQNKKQLNLAIGANIALAYPLTNNMSLRISSGINKLTGNAYDGITSNRHATNLVLNNNISLVWNFAKKKTPLAPQTPNIPIPQPKDESKTQLEKQREIEQQQQIILKQREIERIEQQQIELQIKQQKEIQRQTEVAQSIIFPKFYFEFNVSASSQTKFDESITETINLLNQNPLIAITIKGYTDRRGTSEVNLRVSLGRANTLKQILIANGVAPERIIAKGMGVDKTAKTTKASRRAEIHLTVTQ